MHYLDICNISFQNQQGKYYELIKLITELKMSHENKYGVSLPLYVVHSSSIIAL